MSAQRAFVDVPEDEDLGYSPEDPAFDAPPRSRDSSAGVACWHGPSLLTGDPIAVVLTGIASPSRNAKTGPMVQAYIVPTTVNAGRAVSTSAERAVCGDCPLRGTETVERLCYVTFGVWVVGRHMDQGNFATVEPAVAADMLAGKLVRVGAYGDPAAVPTAVWDTLLAKVKNWTGYTHQWKTCDPELKRVLMASCETADGAREAAAAGWRVYRVRWPGAKLLPGEIVCPYETRGVTCDRCRLCRGTATGAKNIVITAHGSATGKFIERYQQVHLPLFEAASRT